MCNTNTQILAKTRDILNRLGIGHYFREKSDSGSTLKSNLQCWAITMETLGTAYKFLMFIQPYLVGKQFQADCLIEFCNRRLKVADRKGKTNKDRQYTPREYELISEILDANGNRRGSSETARNDAQRAMIQSELVRNHERGSETALRLYGTAEPAVA